MDETKPIRHLTCCCCGGEAIGRQWHNRDTGFGLCGRCATRIAARGKTPPDQMRQSYGGAGVHYFPQATEGTAGKVVTP